MAAIAIGFNTIIPGEKDKPDVTDRKEIAEAYFKGWFAIDFFCAIPWTLFASSASFLKLAPVLRLLRVLKLIRMNKVS